METPSALGTAEALRRLAQRRDPEAWTVLVERHGGEIFAVARQILRDEGLAEDATQEALLLVRDHAGQFKPPEAEADTAARGWLLKLACNAALQMLRSRKRAQARDERAGAERGGREPSDEAQRDAALAELARLPDEQRQPLTLHFCGGLEYAQVAVQLGVPVGTAKARAHRGLETLRRRLAVLGLFLTFEQLGGLFGGSTAEAAEAAARPSASQQQGWRELLESARKPLPAPPPETGGWTTMGKAGMLLGALALAAIMSVSAAVPRGEPDGRPDDVPVVREIHFKGNARLSRERLLGVLSTRIGEPFDTETWDRDWQRMAMLDDVLHVRSGAPESMQDGIRLTVDLVEKAEILCSRILFDGNKAFGEFTLKPIVKTGRLYLAGQAHLDAQAIARFYHQAGYLDAQVRPEVEEVASHEVELGDRKVKVLDEVALIFNIKEGVLTAADTRGEEPALPPVEKLNAADKDALARAGNAFAMDLFGQFRQKEGNLFFSPYSVSTALGMLHPGARGATAEQIGKVLHAPFGGERLAGAYAALLSDQNTIDGEARPYVLRVANRIWAQQGLPLEPRYVATTRQYFGAPTEWLDFIRRPEDARAAVNAWIAERTEQMILEMLHPGEIDAETRLLLVNAIYFKGDWAKPFEKKHTEDRAFEPKAGDRVAVPMMWKHEDVDFCENEKVKLLRLPYKGETVAAYFILPAVRHGLGAVEAGLNLSDFETWRKGLRERKVNVLLPRLKLRARADLVPPLSVLGMPDAFKLGRADFTGIVADGKLFLSRALHEAVLEMDEVGTRAAAATVFELKDEGRPKEFVADQPYLLLLRDEVSGAILFMGRIADPS